MISVASLTAFGVAAEDTEEVGDLRKVVEGVDGDGGIGASQEIQIKEVFPRLAAERAEEGVGDIAGAEDKRSLPLRVGGGAEWMPAGIIGGAQEEEPGKILAVAFDGAAENVGPVDFGGDGTGDGGGIGKLFFGDHLHAAGGVVKRNFFDFPIFGKEIETLI